jgi:2-polyprenyl-6-methoxyphenol hydroxylase-like FAD-dependent oxidoreductase
VAKIVVLGAGVVGLGTAMLLADDGHDVVVLERDATEPASSPEEVWSDWERRGVNQFRLPHIFLARYRAILDAELPRVAKALDRAGALRINFLEGIPESLRGPGRPEDVDCAAFGGRRPVVEGVVSASALATKRLVVRRGETVEALLAGPSSRPGVTNVVGVRTDAGELHADLVVDMMGRRSPLPRLLDEVGASPPDEELEDCGFMYFGRHYRSKDGSVPFMFGPALQDHGTISTVTLPADNGTWGIVVVTSSKDRALLGLRDVERWEAVVAALPLVAHWIDAEPIEDRITTMAKIEDRLRTYVVAGKPVATGVVSVADAWACSNPSHGRGASIGMLHGLVLRDALRDVGLDDPVDFALGFQEATDRVVLPWFLWTRDEDRHRLGEIHAEVDGHEYRTDDHRYELEKSLAASVGKDPELLRLYIRAQMVLDPLEPAITAPDTIERIAELGGGWRDEPRVGPSRDELVKLVAG